MGKNSERRHIHSRLGEGLEGVLVKVGDSNAGCELREAKQARHITGARNGSKLSVHISLTMA